MECQFCKKIFLRKSCFVYHQEIVHRVGPLGWVDQKRSVEPVTFVRCSLCLKRFSDQNQLTLHLKVSPNETPKDSKCQFCKEIFKRQTCFAYHQESVHRVFKPKTKENVEEIRNLNKATKVIPKNLLPKDHKINDVLVMKKNELKKPQIWSKQKRESSDIEVIDEILVDSPPQKIQKISNGSKVGSKPIVIPLTKKSKLYTKIPKQDTKNKQENSIPEKLNCNMCQGIFFNTEEFKNHMTTVHELNCQVIGE